MRRRLNVKCGIEQVKVENSTTRALEYSSEEHSSDCDRQSNTNSCRGVGSIQIVDASRQTQLGGDLNKVLVV